MKLAPLTFALVGGLLALPGCGKKNEPAAGGGADPTGGYTGSKAGPPGGFPPPAGFQPATGGTWAAVQVAQAREQTSENLKQIGLALHNFNDVNGAFPLGYYDKTGKTVGLSWRVAILPYLDQDLLFKQFKLDEPWDSEHNKKLIPMMPKVFAAPGATEIGTTFYRGFTGEQMMFTPTKRPGQPGTAALGRKITEIPDGTSNTAMVVEGGAAVPWTKPDTLTLDPKNPAGALGGVFDGVFHALRCDGSWTAVKKTLDAETMRRFAVINDGLPFELPEQR